MDSRNVLFLIASTREPGVVGNTEWLARQAARALPADAPQTWLYLHGAPPRGLRLPPFEDHRHDHGTYPMPEGDAHTLMQATLAASDIVFVSPVYWYSAPAPLKLYLDHWSAWMRVPGVDFKNRMAGKRLWAVTTGGDRERAQPMWDSFRYSAEFLAMQWRGVLWGKGGAPGKAAADAQAVAAAACFFGA
jgi:multimeric flavodoxin WrbA